MASNEYVSRADGAPGIMKKKTCRNCGEDKPVNKFPKNRAKCNVCMASYKRDLRKGKRHPSATVKTCRKCGKFESDVDFARANICKPCNREYMRKYRKKNRGRIAKQTQDWKKNNRERHRATNRKRYSTPEGKTKHITRVERTYRSWLSHLISRIKTSNEVSIDLDYVCRLWEKQKGRCALTNIPVVHQYHNMLSISIDRIDSNKDYMKGNIQLICQGLRSAKREHGNNDARLFIEAIIKNAKRVSVEAVKDFLAANAVPVGNSGAFRAERRKKDR